MLYKKIDHCLSCKSHEFNEVLSLGESAIIKFKDSEDEQDDIAPLLLRECKNCKLVQLSHVVHRDRLFKKYWYRSGVNKSMRDTLKEIVISAENQVELDYDDWVIDIGSNDGTLLRNYRGYIRKVGFEPAKIDSPYIIVDDYFNLKSAQYLIKQYGKKPKIITAIAMFYDIEDPNKFLQDVKAVLHEDGIFILQLNTLDAMVKNYTIDNISHEHLCYYSIQVLCDLLKKNGFVVLLYDENDVNGGSVRVYCKHKGFSYPRIENLEVDWAKWRAELEQKRNKIRAIIEKEKEKHGFEIWGYGASTRGFSLIQWLGVEKHLNKIADRNPEKWGKYLGNIPICSEAEMRMAHPPLLFVLPYSFKGEFIMREKEYFARGGHMIFPLPEPDIFPY